MAPSESHARPLVELGRVLLRAGYSFTTVTPRTHETVIGRQRTKRADLRDVFGWNRPFSPSEIPPEILALSHAAGALEIGANGLARSTVRFATLGGRIFVHSGYPTDDKDAVFFGPDTYRFCAALERLAPRARRAVDVGCGAGVGGIVLAGRADRVVLADVSAHALFFARINLRLAGLEDVEVVEADVLDGVEGPVDLVVANPPYMNDDAERTYRDGGGAYGEGLALRIADEALDRLAPGGTVLLYTGAPIVEGTNIVTRGIEPIAKRHAATMTVEEIDPDLFGEELEKPKYRDVERIAAIVVRLVRG